MPSLSALLGVAAATLSVASATKYTVQDTYPGSSFFDHFNFVTTEKTNGFVNYVDQATATTKGYIKYDNGDAVFGVDYKTKLNSANGGDVGRDSVRLEGKVEYNKGLFVLDVKHMPGGICGTWPSFWSLGREPWPVKGEIDIFEGVNKNSANTYALHTDTQCKTSGLGQTGTQALTDCALDSSSGSTGCSVTDPSTKSFGAGFNSNNGGYYVTEWQAEGIKIWFFPRGSEPSSLTSSSPDTSDFGTPHANFQGDCDIEKRFMDQRFIFTNTFCGDWAGNVYAQSGCPMYTGLSGMDSCKKYVAENPAVFENAYWRVGSFKTYNKRTTTSSSSVAPSSTPHASSSSVRVSSSSIRVSSSSVARSSSIASSSVARSSSVASSSAARSSSIASSSVARSSSVASSSVARSSSVASSSAARSSSIASSSVARSSSIASSSVARSSSIASSSVVRSSSVASSSVASSSAAFSPVAHSNSVASSSIAHSNPVASSSIAHSSSVASSSIASSSVAFSSIAFSPVRHGNSVASSSVVHSSATPTPHVSSSVQLSSTPVGSSSYPADFPSPSSSSSVSETSYVPSSIPAPETPHSHGIPSRTSSSSYPVFSPSETPYGSSSILYPSSSSNSAYPDVPSYPVDGKSPSSTPVYSTSAPVYSVYPEGEGYRYGDVSSKTPDASLKSFGYPVVSSKSSKAPEYDAHPTPSAKTPEYDSYPVAHSSTPVYGNDYPASTAGAKSTPVHADYPVAPSSTPVYGNDYPAYSISSSKPVHNHYSASTPGVKSTPVYADYPELPSFTPLYSTYAAVSSKPSYGDDKKSTASYKTATAYETTYVDVCSTGYTTITTKVTAIQTPGLKPTGGAYYAPPGFEVTTKYCAQGCGEGPKTVTVTVPCSKCQASKPTNKASSVPSKPTGIPNKPTGNTPYTPAQPSKPVTPQGSTTKATATKIITLTKIPIPESQYYATHSSIASPSASLIKYPDSDSGKSYANSKPVAPTSAGYVGGDKPVYPTGSAPASKPVVPTGSAPASKPIAPTGSVGGGKPVYPTGSAPASKPVVPTGSAPASKPIAPTGSIGGGKPVYPTAGVPGTVGYPGSNVTISYGTATSAKGKPTQTASNVPEFTGAASSLRVGGVVAGAAIALAAMMM